MYIHTFSAKTIKVYAKASVFNITLSGPASQMVFVHYSINVKFVVYAQYYTIHKSFFYHYIWNTISEF